jgi:hypothetical protein
VLLFILSLTKKVVYYTNVFPLHYTDLSPICVCACLISLTLSLSVHMFPEMDKAQINVTESGLLDPK